MIGRKAEQQPPVIAETVEVLISKLRIQKEITISNGVNAVYETYCRSGETLPVHPISSVSDLREFLKDKCTHVNAKNEADDLGCYSTDQAIFLVVHPASGVKTSNYGAYVSLCLHNETAYSDLR